jgi:hypothetical protein
MEKNQREMYSFFFCFTAGKMGARWASYLGALKGRSGCAQGV